MKRITEYQIIDHGVHHNQYFQGCGVAYTKYDVAVTGIGDSAFAALDDALEQLASMGYTIPKDLDAELDNVSHSNDVAQIYADSGEPMPDYGELYYHMSIRVKE